MTTTELYSGYTAEGKPSSRFDFIIIMLKKNIHWSGKIFEIFWARFLRLTNCTIAYM